MRTLNTVKRTCVIADSKMVRKRDAKESVLSVAIDDHVESVVGDRVRVKAVFIGK